MLGSIITKITIMGIIILIIHRVQRAIRIQNIMEIQEATIRVLDIIQMQEVIIRIQDTARIQDIHLTII